MVLKSSHFEPVSTFECGQCFRWEKCENGYRGIVKGAILTLRPDARDYRVEIEKALYPIEDAYLAHYFDEHADYDSIWKHLKKKDRFLKTAVSNYKGMRLLNQEPFETLITFIISANNNIPKIKMSVEALSQRFGTYIGTIDGREYYSFPTVEALAEASLEALQVKGIGYRAKAVSLTAKRILEESIDLEKMRQLSYIESKNELTKFYGVGEKVADCVLLFSLGHKQAFPIDTWVKKMLQTLYEVEDHPRAYKDFVENYFTDYGGYAQQFLFYYMRENKNGIGDIK